MQQCCLKFEQNTNSNHKWNKNASIGYFLLLSSYSDGDSVIARGTYMEISPRDLTLLKAKGLAAFKGYCFFLRSLKVKKREKKAPARAKSI